MSCQHNVENAESRTLLPMYSFNADAIKIQKIIEITYETKQYTSHRICSEEQTL